MLSVCLRTYFQPLFCSPPVRCPRPVTLGARFRSASIIPARVEGPLIDGGRARLSHKLEGPTSELRLQLTLQRAEKLFYRLSFFILNHVLNYSCNLRRLICHSGSPGALVCWIRSPRAKGISSGRIFPRSAARKHDSGAIETALSVSPARLDCSLFHPSTYQPPTVAAGPWPLGR